MKPATMRAALEAIADGRLRTDTIDGGGLPPALYPDGWIARAEVLEAGEVDHSSLVDRLICLEGLNAAGAIARVRAMLKAGQIEGRRDLLRGTVTYRALPGMIAGVQREPAL